jgi:DNA polymerase III delta subunit
LCPVERYTQTVLIYLYGPDSYRRREKLHALVREYRMKHSLGDMIDVDLEEAPDDWKRVRDYLNQPSMFSEAKAAVVRECRTVDEKQWCDFLKSHIGTPKTFVFVSDAASPTKPFAFLLDDHVVSQEFPVLSERVLEAFLHREADARALSFTPDAWRFFCEYVGANPEPSWNGVNELEKIALAGFPKPTTLANLRTLIDWLSHRDVPYAARQILTATGIERRLSHLEALLAQHEAPSYIFNSLGFQSQGTAALALADYDVSVKRGELEYEEALLDFVLRE